MGGRAHLISVVPLSLILCEGAVVVKVGLWWRRPLGGGIDLSLSHVERKGGMRG